MTHTVPLDEAAMEARKRFISNIIQMVCEIPDRTSPDDQPEMMLVTGEDLDNIVSIAFERADEADEHLSALPVSAGPTEEEVERGAIQVHNLVTGAVWSHGNVDSRGYATRIARACLTAAANQGSR